jgi:hypothetical protein
MESFVSDRRDIQPELIPTPEGLGGDVIISPDTLGRNRLPPRQSRTRKWPVLDAFGPPDIDLEEWQFEIGGLVESSLALNWEEFQKLRRVKVFADMHCVTRWSRLGNLWEGVSTAEVIARVRVLPQARYVLVNAYDGDWTTNLPERATVQIIAKLRSWRAWQDSNLRPLAPEANALYQRKPRNPMEGFARAHLPQNRDHRHHKSQAM